MTLRRSRRARIGVRRDDRQRLRRGVLTVVVVLTAGLVLSWLIAAMLLHFARGTLEKLSASAA